VLVTGAGGGLGAAIAARFAAGGCQVGVLDVDADAARRCAAGLPGDAMGLEASVTDPVGVEAALTRFGLPDVVVNNAGIVRFGPLAALDLADWRAVVDVNLTGTFVVARAVASRWLSEARPGTIVNVTSMNGVAPGPGSGAHGSTKAAVALLTQQMALEWGPFGIRVNAVAPGLVDGGMSAPIYADDAIRLARSSKVPLGRLGLPADIAEAVWWLASDAAAYVTGQQLVVDGGVTMAMIANLPRPAA
jgi:NAD(P)-dependent dehydrogenase (short-subunit alcohol dehydrogenase family)